MHHALASRSKRYAAAAVVVLFFSACSDSTGAGATVSGTYSLQTVGGVSLPAPAKDASGVVVGTATSGTVTLTSTNTYSSSITFLIGGVSTTAPGTGTYVLSGNTVTFNPTGGGGATTAIFSGGNTLSVTLNAQAYVFRK